MFDEFRNDDPLAELSATYAQEHRERENDTKLMQAEKIERLEQRIKELERGQDCAKLSLQVKDGKNVALTQRNRELEQALKKCVLVLSGEAMTKQELINALELSRKALEGKP